ncbi:type III secretion system stator protein SctL [Planctomycetota bacterium]
MRKVVPPNTLTGLSPVGRTAPQNAPSPVGATPLGSTLRMSRGASTQRLSPQAYDAYEEAKNILTVAEQEAERIRQEAEQLRNEHIKQGYDEGYRKGYGEALQGLARLEKEYSEELDRLEPEVVQLSVQIAEKILGEEMQLRPEAIIDIVAQALRTVRHQKDIVVRVNPSQVPIMEAQKSTLLGILSRAREVRIVSDESLRPGGCIIETEVGILDADIQTQLEEIRSALANA